MDRDQVRFEHDVEADAAYIAFGEISAGEAVRQVFLSDERIRGEIIVDLDADDRVLGIELIGLSSMTRPVK